MALYHRAAAAVEEHHTDQAAHARHHPAVQAPAGPAALLALVHPRGAVSAADRDDTPRRRRGHDAVDRVQRRRRVRGERESDAVGDVAQRSAARCRRRGDAAAHNDVRAHGAVATARDRAHGRAGGAGAKPKGDRAPRRRASRHGEHGARGGAARRPEVRARRVGDDRPLPVSRFPSAPVEALPDAQRHRPTRAPAEAAERANDDKRAAPGASA